MEKQVPIRESRIQLKQIHGGISQTRRISQTLNRSITNVLSGKVSGTAGYLAKFTSEDELGDSVIYETSSNIGINTENPNSKLHVLGRVLTCALALDCSPVAGQVLTAADTAGNAVWSEAPGLPVAIYASTGDLTLSGTQTVDGQSPADGDTILVKDQSTSSENGLYSYNSSTAWSRTGDAIYAGMLITVLQGSTNADTLWHCTNATDPDIGVDAITFTSHPRGTAPANYVPKMLSSHEIVQSQITDDGTSVKINTTNTGAKFLVEWNTSTIVAAIENAASSGDGVGLLAKSNSSSVTSYAAELSAAGGGSGMRIVTTGTGKGLVFSSGSTGHLIDATQGANGTAINATRNFDGATATLVAIADQHAGSTATALDIDQDGKGHALHINRNNSAAVTPVVSVRQDHASNAKNAIEARNDGTGTAAGALFGRSTGGIAVYGQSDTYHSQYAYRNSNTATVETAVIWQDHTGDANDVLRIRGDGTGKILLLEDGGVQVLAVEDGGVVNTRGSGVRHSTTAKSANYTITISDHIIFCETATAAGAFTLTLPAPAAGMEFILIDSENNAGANNVILARNGTENIDAAAANLTLNTSNFRTIVWSDGTDWYTK